MKNYTLKELVELYDALRNSIERVERMHSPDYYTIQRYNSHKKRLREVEEELHKYDSIMVIVEADDGHVFRQEIERKYGEEPMVAIKRYQKMLGSYYHICDYWMIRKY